VVTALVAFFFGVGVTVGTLLVLVWRESIKIYEDKK
jgi:hypothetical protein